MFVRWLVTLLTIGIYTSKCKPIGEYNRNTSYITNLTFKFNCLKRTIGFYADLDYDCKIFHMCDQKKRRIPHICPENTSFNQEYRICDWDYNFNCSDSPKWYHLNELTYKSDETEGE